MRIVTISREFGSGGRELGKRLAGLLGYDYYDREIITAIAKQKGLDESYVEIALEKQDWQAMPLTFGRSFAGIYGMQQMQTNLLVAQKSLEAINGGETNAYHLTVNTEGWDMEELASAMERFVLRWYGR